jgi:hypothetical protein
MVFNFTLHFKRLSNSDGKIDANDAAWNRLKIYQDIEGDGFSTADEFLTPDELRLSLLIHFLLLRAFMLKL